MPRNCCALLTLALLCAGPGLSPVRAAAAEGGGATAPGLANHTATLPLAEVLRLYRENQTLSETKPERPPLTASVTKLELGGRLLEGAVEVTAHVELSILATEGWVTVRLLRKDAAMRITRLPTIEHAVFSIADGYLVMLTDKPGAYAFDLSFLSSAQASGDKRKVEVSYPGATLALLKLRFDEHLFSLRNSDRIPESDGYTLFPQANRFVVEWQRNQDAARAAEPAVRRTPIESVVTAAHASLVSTLEGRRILRVLYELQFEGSRSIVFTIPNRQTLEKVYLNGASVPFRITERSVSLPVTPSRAGDESAHVELLLSEEQGGYALSGQLDYSFPACSWSVNDLYVTLSLPQVYNYKWEGGSLAPIESAQEVEYTQHLPTPGKAIHLHQQLLSKAATVRIAYTVDLSGSYYRGGGLATALPETPSR